MVASPTAFVVLAAGTVTQGTTGPIPANIDLTTGAVVAFELLLLGLAAAILLTGRFLRSGRKT